MTSQGKRMLAIAGPLLAMLVLLGSIVVLWRSGAGREAVTAPRIEAFPHRTSQLPAVDGSRGARSQVAGSELPLEEVLESDAEVDAPEDAVQGTFVVAGIVVEEGTGIPIPGVRAGVVPLDEPGQVENPHFVDALTDTEGRFELRLDASLFRRSRFHRTRVLDESDQLVFHRSVLLQDFLVLTLPRKIVLRGVLTTSPSFDLSGVEVQASNVPDASAIAWTCGSARLDASGSFTIRCAPRDQRAAMRLQFWDRDGALGIADVSLDVLTSPEGAAIHFDVHSVTVRAVDANLAPVAGLDLRAGVELGRTLTLIAATTTDELGEVRLRFTPGWLTVCAGGAGYHPQTRRIHLDPTSDGDELLLAMRAIGERDVLEGQVLDPEGRPLPEATVSVSSPDVPPDIAVSSIVQSLTDADGRFRIARDPGSAVRVVAHKRSCGISPEVEVGPGVGRVEIQFTNIHPLEIHLRSAPGSAAFATGPAHYFVVHRDLEFAIEDLDDGVPIEVEGLIEGDYNVFVHVPSGDLYGQASCRVDSWGASTVEVWLDPAERFSGRVVDSSGRARPGLRVQIVEPSWPESVTERWGSGGTDSDGGFGVLGASPQRAVVRVLDGASELMEAVLDPGAPTTIVLTD